MDKNLNLLVGGDALEKITQNKNEKVRGVTEQDLGRNVRSRCFASPYGFDFGLAPYAQDDNGNVMMYAFGILRW